MWILRKPFLIARKDPGPGLGQFAAMNLSDVWRTALDLKKQYANEAASVASERAERSFAVGDMDGFRVWNRVQHAIVEIEREPKPHEVMH